MLQQTRVSRVLENYPRFLKAFPTFGSLAASNSSDVIRAWRGMGYNNRAIRLHQLSRTVVSRGKKSTLPQTREALEALPGIGKYTAHAVASFAFRQHVPVVDTNVRRVLQRLFPRATSRRNIWDLARSVLPSRNSYDWNQSLMDLGSVVCTAARPKCNLCPASGLCPSAFRPRVIMRRRRSQEPRRAGIPRRVYRGRIVEVLRDLPGKKTIPASRLGRKIKPDFHPGDRRWLSDLLRKLQNEGLVRITNGRGVMHIGLPH